MREKNGSRFALGVFFASLLAQVSHEPQKFNPPLLVVQIILAVVIAYLFYELNRFWERSESKKTGIIANRIFLNDRRWIFWIMFYFSFAVFLTWLIGQWPGIMTKDSLDSWEQTITLRITNASPYMYQIYVLFFRQLFDSPATICVFQITAMSALGSYIFYYSIKRGLQWYLVLPFYLSYVCSIPIGLYNITLWKDIPFSILTVFWAFYLYKRSYERKTKIRPEYLVILSCLFTLLCSFRHNGIIYSVLIPLLIFLFKLMSRRELLKFISISLILIIFIQYILPAPLGIKDDTRYVKFSTIINPLASLLTSRPAYTTNDYYGDRMTIERWISVKKIKELYNPDSAGPIMFDKEAKTSFRNLSDEQVNAIYGVFFKRAAQNLPIIISSRSRIFMTMMKGPTYYYENCLTMPEIKDSYVNNVVFSPLDNDLYGVQITLMSASLENYFIFWNTLIPALLLIAVAALYMFLPRSFIYSIVFLFQLPFLFWVINSPDFRYIYYIYLSGFFIIPLVLLELKNRKHSDA